MATAQLRAPAAIAKNWRFQFADVSTARDASGEEVMLGMFDSSEAMATAGTSLFGTCQRPAYG